MIPYIKITLRILTMMVFARLFYMLVRHQILAFYGVELWEVWTQNGDIIHKFHDFVDWISTLENIDVYPYEM
jgi:hypothetical protein